MAFARAKVHWANMDDVKLMTEGPPEGKEHRRPELYYDSVLKGSRLVVEQRSKDIIFKASIFAQCTLTQAKAIGAPSMHTDRLIASIWDTTSRSRRTRPK